MTSKRASETRVSTAQIMQPNDANFHGYVFGGVILSMIDLTSYAVSGRFAEKLTVTASFDRVDFHEPIEVGELVEVVGYVTYVGRTSMEITLEIYADNVLKGNRRHTNTARVTMVAIEDGKPVEVPRLICESREDKIRFIQGRLRREVRKLHIQELHKRFAEVESATDEELDALIAQD
ncbi:MAG: acyl-CoA thioesterase [Fimbriimonadaceae bacterium]|nr:acyl-CoA thioesterase [Fimbriimonadaceae bacterium]